MRRVFRLGVSFMAVLAVSQLNAASADAAIGDLVFSEAISMNVPGATAPFPVNSLVGVNGLAMPPDGRSLYVAASGGPTGTSAALTWYSRSFDGSLRFVDCVGAMYPCGRLPSTSPSIRFTRVVAIAWDVYAISDGHVFHYVQDDGRLRFSQCFSVRSPGGDCASLTSLGTPAEITVGAQGVYVLSSVGSTGSAVHHFTRSLDTGQLRHAGCIGENAPGCRPTGHRGAMRWPSGLAVSPDGASLYTTGGFPGAIVHFRMDRLTGSLSEAGCLGRGGTGCTDPGTDALANLDGLAISPGSEDLYVSGSAMSQVRRVTATGDLFFVGCHSAPRQPISGCRTDLPSSFTGKASSIASSPDGRSVYVMPRDSSVVPGAVLHLSRDASGHLTYAGCVGDDPAQCTTPRVRGVLNPASGIAVSPQSDNVYAVANTDSGALARFRRIG